MQFVAARTAAPESGSSVGRSTSVRSTEDGIDDWFAVLQALNLSILVVDQGGMIQRVAGLYLLPCSQLSFLSPGTHFFYGLPQAARNPVEAGFQTCLATGQAQQCRAQLVSPDNTIGRQVFEFNMASVSGEVVVSITDKTVEVAYRNLLTVRNDADEKLAGLTGKERAILQLIAEGHSNKGMAWKHGVSIKTIEKHRSRMMKKLNAGSVVDAVRVWLQADGSLAAESN